MTQHSLIVCSAIVPVTVERVGRQDTGPHPEYKGEVLFQNKFDGALPATDYPKVNVSAALCITSHIRLSYPTSSTLQCSWCTPPLPQLGDGCVGGTCLSCFRFRCVLAITGVFSPINGNQLQYYLSGLIALLVIEMAANWVYYRYLNAHGENTSALVFLFVGTSDVAAILAD